MSSILGAGAPLETPRHRIGRFSSVLSDDARDGRVIPVDVWYPAGPDRTAVPSVYELLPGIGFTAAAEDEAEVADGPHPLVLWSHGRTGTRTSYALLCEAIAARGFVVLTLEHAGDSLADWLLGAAADDETNEINRVADARFVLDTVLDPNGPLRTFATRVDPDRIAAAGHSYGGFTALSLAGGDTPDPRVRAAAGLESLTRSIPKQSLEQIKVPTLLVVGRQDATTPPETDAERAWAKLGADPAWRVDIEHAGHQGCSDVGLYLELAPQIAEIPEIVKGYVESMAADVTGTAGDPWRPTVALHVRILGAFLDGALAIDVGRANRELASVSELDGVTVSNRGSFGVGTSAG